MIDVENRSVIVTGASGYIGASVAKALSEAGFDVNLLLRPSSKLKYFGEILKMHKRWDCLRSDEMLSALNASRSKIIFHLAAAVENDDNEGTERLIEGNFTFGARLLNAAIKSGCKYFINTGSYWQFDSKGKVNPISLYADLKQAFQSLLMSYGCRHGLSIMTLILYDVYGEYDQRWKIVDLLAKAAKNDELIELTQGYQIIDLVNIDDVVHSYLIAMDYLHNNPKNTYSDYFIRNERMTLRKLVEIYYQATGKVISCKWGAKPYPENIIMDPFQGPILPGWAPKVEIGDWLLRFRNKG